MIPYPKCKGNPAAIANQTCDEKFVMYFFADEKGVAIEPGFRWTVLVKNKAAEMGSFSGLAVQSTSYEVWTRK